MKLEKLANFALDLVFPPRCFWCDEVLPLGQSCHCETEIAEYLLGTEPVQQKAQTRIRKFPPNVYAVYRYQGIVRQAVLRFKFEDEPEKAGRFGQAMARTIGQAGLAQQFDLLVPIPVSKKTYRKRGYNQSFLLARESALGCGIPCDGEMLIKIKETKPQRMLDKKHRETNIQGAFAIKPGINLAGKRVLLVDDIVTTGSTLAEAYKTILNNGAFSCGAICLSAAPEMEKEKYGE